MTKTIEADREGRKVVVYLLRFCPVAFPILNRQDRNFLLLLCRKRST